MHKPEHSRVMVVIALVTLLLSSGCDRQIDDPATVARPSAISLPVEPSIHPSLIPPIPTSTTPRLTPTTTASPPEPTITVRATDTLQPASRPHILDLLPVDPLMLFVSETNTRYAMLNIVTGETWQLNLTPVGAYSFIAWSQNGCEMLMSYNTYTEDRVLRLDLRGNILDELVSLDHLDAFVQRVAINPAEDKLAYEAVRFTSTPEPGQERFPFLEVIDLSNPMHPTHLAENYGGDPALAWSPDGEWLAFGEYDDQQVLQVVISRPDGSERYQITRFTDPNANIYTLRWSPDGKSLAFHYDQSIYDPDLSLVVVSNLPANPTVNVLKNDSITNFGYFWWQSQNTIGVWSGSVYWVDAANSQVVDVLPEAEIPEGFIQFPRPFGDLGLIGFFSSSTDFYYIFDTHSRALERMVNARDPLSGIIPFEDLHLTPVTFPGEEMCQDLP